MRAVADEYIGALIDRLTSELRDEIGALLEFGAGARREQARPAEFVAVGADDQPVRLPARFANPAQIILQVALVGLGFD